MAVYSYRCKSCGEPYEEVKPLGQASVLVYCDCGLAMARDYAAERVNVGPAVGSTQRDRKASDQRDLFLPTRKDFEKPGDPDGSKGVKHWNRRHENAARGSGKFRPS